MIVMSSDMTSFVYIDDEKHHLSKWLGKENKCSKILNTFLFLFSNKMFVFRGGLHKMLVRTAKREEVCYGSAMFVYAFLKGKKFSKF